MAQAQTITADQRGQQGIELASLGTLGKLRELLQKGKELYQRYGRSAGLGLGYGAAIGFTSGISPWSLEGQAAIEAGARAYAAKGATPDQVAAFRTGATVGMEAGRLAREAGINLNSLRDQLFGSMGVPQNIANEGQVLAEQQGLTTTPNTAGDQNQQQVAQKAEEQRVAAQPRMVM